jgi:hypothetical protein
MDVHPVISGGYGQQKRWGTTYDILETKRKGAKIQTKMGIPKIFCSMNLLQNGNNSSGTKPQKDGDIPWDVTGI